MILNAPVTSYNYCKRVLIILITTYYLLMRCKKKCGNMQNHVQMKESKCAKDILKCANEKRRADLDL